MDGLQAAREICARWPRENRPRIVALTANASTGDRDECLAAGMDSFITKPMRPEELRAVLQATVARRPLAPAA
jgi:CheY-like chemotaxis protein